MDYSKQRRAPVKVVLDEDVRSVVEKTAERERGSVSGVCRRVVTEWANREEVAA